MFEEKKTNLPVECISLSLILYASLTFLGKENSEKSLRTSISTERCNSARYGTVTVTGRPTTPSETTGYLVQQ